MAFISFKALMAAANAGDVGIAFNGASSTFNNSDNREVSIDFDPNNTNKCVVAFRDSSNSYYLTAVVGTVSGDSISFGTPYIVKSQNATGIVKYHPSTANKVVVAYRAYDGSTFVGRAAVGTVSGTSISFGSDNIYSSTRVSNMALDVDTNTGTFVLTYVDQVNGVNGVAFAGTVSGTSISFGSKYTFSGTSTGGPSVAFDANTSGKFVVTFRDVGNSQYGTAVVGTASGTTISFGSKYVFNSGTTTGTNAIGGSVAFDPSTSNKFVVAYRPQTSGDDGKVVAGTISGTSISYGSSAQFTSGRANGMIIVFDPNLTDTFMITYQDFNDSSRSSIIPVTLSGTSFSFGDSVTFTSSTGDYPATAFDPNTTGTFLVGWRDAANSNKGTALVGTLST
jgi:hypothetical protein